jgi:hypothetical protein
MAAAFPLAEARRFRLAERLEAAGLGRDQARRITRQGLLGDTAS